MAKDDFFEEEVGGGGKAKKGGKQSTKAPPKTSTNMSNTINLYLAVGLIITAFVIGFFARGIVWPSEESAIPTNNTEMQQAPPLSQEQIEQGQMPAGHPQVTPPETSTPSGTPTTPSETSTAPKGTP